MKSKNRQRSVGLKEYWSISFVAGQWRISGKLVKAERVVGEFHGVDVIYDSTKGTLYFLQVFDVKPDAFWIASNDIEASALGDKLKLKIRGVEALLTRAQSTGK